jgi:hypothetical protein
MRDSQTDTPTFSEMIRFGKGRSVLAFTLKRIAHGEPSPGRATVFFSDRIKTQSHRN